MLSFRTRKLYSVAEGPVDGYRRALMLESRKGAIFKVEVEKYVILTTKFIDFPL
jgi:hypothetical protein